MNDSQMIHLRLNSNLIAAIDKAAQQEYTSRSEYIRRAILDKTRNHESLSHPKMSIDLLMSNQQLDYTLQALLAERRRRRNYHQ